MSDQPSANHATTFKLALLAMLVSIWLLGRASEPDKPEPKVDELGFVIEPPLDPDSDEQIVPLVKVDEIDANAPGSVVGFVRYAGEKQAPLPLTMTADPYCEAYYRGRPLPMSERWVWGENDTVQNVLVHVTGGLPDKNWEAPSNTAIIRMEGCLYVPHASAIMLGQLVEIHNADQTLHNPHPVPVNGQGIHHIQQYGLVTPWFPTKAETGIFVKCDVHPWMTSYVHVMSHPFFSLTGQEGSFEIKNLPPGEYEISLWHEVKTFRNSVKPMQVKIEAGKATHIEFTIDPANGIAPAQD